MSQLIKFTTETPSDIPQEYLDKFDISVVPLHVNHDGKDYKDGELTNQYIYDTFREKKILPSTSAVAVGEYQDFFRPFLAEGKTIIHVAMSSGISSTYQNACIAAEDLEEDGKVYVIDSKKLSLATAVLVFKGAEMAENGMAAEDIVAALEDMVPKVDNTFIITSLEFLRHGGRCSAMEAFGANLLKLKPMINMVDGSMEVEKKYRGQDLNVYLQYIEERLDGIDYDDEYVLFGNVLLDDAQKKEVIRKLKKDYDFKNIVYNDLGTVIMSHGGKGAMGVWFIRK